jgi:hypothetical protein
LDKKGVSNFGVRWRVKDLQSDGLALAAELSASQQWHVEQRGPFEAGFGKPAPKLEHHLHIPFIVMTAASTDEFRLRHGDPATPERIAEWLRMSLRAWTEGQCDGVVTYCLDKSPESPVFPLTQKLLGEFMGRPR